MIRTYELSHESKTPLYVQLYEAIRADILSGSLPGGGETALLFLLRWGLDTLRQTMALPQKENAP